VALREVNNLIIMLESALTTSENDATARDVATAEDKKTADDISGGGRENSGRGQCGDRGSRCRLSVSNGLWQRRSSRQCIENLVQKVQIESSGHGQL